MKEIWVCQWEIVPDGIKTEEFPTLAAAKRAMREKITQSIDLEEYVSDLEPAAANYLRRFLADPGFPRSEEDVPEEYGEPEYGDLSLSASGIRWDHPYDAYPCLNTNLLLEEDGTDSHYFDFWYNVPEKAAGNGVKGMSVRIYPRIDYGTSAYPLMVLFALREYPQNQEQLARTILKTWATRIDRKAVGRHLQLLQDMGFAVQRGPEGYYYGAERCAPKPDMHYSPSAYPLMICEVLDGTPKTQTEIIRQVQETFGVAIDRKAVSRHLALLDALGFRLEKSRNGYAMKLD